VYIIILEYAVVTKRQVRNTFEHLDLITAAYLMGVIISSQICNHIMPFDGINNKIITPVGCIRVGNKIEHLKTEHSVWDLFGT